MPDYRLKIYKSYGARSGRDNWSNTHEFRLDSPIEHADMITAVQQFVAFEGKLHASSVQFMRAVVSLMDVEKDGYVANEVRILDVAGQGQRVAAGENLLDTNLVLAVKRFSTVGRSGYLYLRGCLFESDVNADSRGFAEMTPDANLALSQLLVQGGIDYFTAPKVPQLSARTDDPDVQGEQVVIRSRDITSLQVMGIKLIPRTHKWFNRDTEAVAP